MQGPTGSNLMGKIFFLMAFWLLPPVLLPVPLAAQSLPYDHVHVAVPDVPQAVT